MTAEKKKGEEDKVDRFAFFKRHGRTILAVVSAVVVFISIGYWMLSVYDQQEKISIVVAARDIEAPSIIKSEDVRIAKIPRVNIPKTAIAEVDAVVGVTLLRPMSEKEILTTNHLFEGVSAGSDSILVGSSAYAFSLPSSWLAGAPPKVAANDYIQILASVADKTVEAGTTVIAKSLRVIKVDSSKDGATNRLLLEVQPYDAAKIAQAHANQLVLVVLVESSARADEQTEENSDKEASQ